jgi:hypothetical protein
MALVPAGASAATKPTPCTGELSFNDPAGDAFDPLLSPAQPNMDLLGGFFTADEGASALEVDANVVVANLNRQVPPGSESIEWQMLWQAGARGYYVWADIDPEGKLTFGGAGYDSTGVVDETFATQGRLYEGGKGVVQIRIPARLAPRGATLENPYASSLERVAGVYLADDYAPDQGYGKNFSVKPCPALLRVAVSPRRTKRGRRTRFGFSVSAPQGGRSAPVAGAAVRFAGRRATTNARGRASITTTLSRPGRYRAAVTKPGFRAGSAEVLVTR